MRDTVAMDTRVTVQYFDGCPSWTPAVAHVREAAELAGVDVEVRLEEVATLEDAVRVGFPGSPTILIDGQDAFASNPLPPALTCRLYRTPEGASGSPSVAQLVEALTSAVQVPRHG